jgi:Na+/melibiose symporter-like transporter
LESFLTELAAFGSDLSGIWWSREFFNKSETADAAFANFEANLRDLIQISKVANSALHQQLTELCSSSRVGEGLAQVFVAIRVERIKKESARARAAQIYSMVGMLASSLSVVFSSFTRKHRVFTDSVEIPLPSIIVALGRIKSMAIDIREQFSRKKHMDDNAFKPSNIDLDFVNDALQAAVGAMSSSTGVGPEIKDTIIKYIESVRAEIVSETPNWKKIVGALVIISAIIQGIAAAPEAGENIKKALNCILGSSIEKIYQQPGMQYNRLLNSIDN